MNNWDVVTVLALIVNPVSRPLGSYFHKLACSPSILINSIQLCYHRNQELHQAYQYFSLYPTYRIVAQRNAPYGDHVMTFMGQLASSALIYYIMVHSLGMPLYGPCQHEKMLSTTSLIRTPILQSLFYSKTRSHVRIILRYTGLNIWT